MSDSFEVFILKELAKATDNKHLFLYRLLSVAQSAANDLEYTHLSRELNDACYDLSLE